MFFPDIAAHRGFGECERAFITRIVNACGKCSERLFCTWQRKITAKQLKHSGGVAIKLLQRICPITRSHFQLKPR